jgi:aconitase A
MTVDRSWSTGHLDVEGTRYRIHRLQAVEEQGLGQVSRLPRSLRILLENLLRHEDGDTVTRDDIAALASWSPTGTRETEIAFRPSRVLLQDFTGVPSAVDLAVMRDAIADMGGDPARINPVRPADLVIDHSVQVDVFGTADAFQRNVEIEYQRNRERYAFLRWTQGAFRNFRVVPPGTGIVHQVNLEYLASVVFDEESGGERAAFPDTLVGTDSHTTMVNALGVVGWGVGGIEAEAALLGQPISMLIDCTASCPRGRPRQTSYSRSCSGFGSTASLGSSSSSSARGCALFRSPIVRPSRTWRRSTARRSASSRSTRRRSTTFGSPAATSPTCKESRHTRGHRVCFRR